LNNSAASRVAPSGIFLILQAAKTNPQTTAKIEKLDAEKVTSVKT
jgi:hypothetical protein